jgi:hypothetical protein
LKAHIVLPAGGESDENMDAVWEQGNYSFVQSRLHSDSTAHCEICRRDSKIPPETLTMKIATAVFAETLYNLQYSAQLLPKNWCHT